MKNRKKFHSKCKYQWVTANPIKSTNRDLVVPNYSGLILKPRNGKKEEQAMLDF